MTTLSLVPAETVARSEGVHTWHGGLSSSENFLHITLIVEKQPSKGLGSRPLALNSQFPELFSVSVEGPQGTIVPLTYGVASGSDPLITSLVANADAVPGDHVLKIESAELNVNYSRTFTIK
ncbi:MULTISPECIES: hypothetical protein [Amycolatopsis]|uniref:Uncharacterized protein n=1 Tax=Amycolatopsis japonica TaxID=208439 RepID=A0A075UX73_9PSEU|nr:MULTISPECIES: hypothetical protein [Amycolatopsis]AIG76996.1 Hypothetical protein AJAP_20680 [Amycolatopsis japonica]